MKALLVGALAILLPSAAIAELLGQTEMSGGIFSQNGVGTHVRPMVLYIDTTTNPPTLSPGIFDHIAINVDDIGTTLSSTATTDSDFPYIVGRLTNAVSEYLFIGAYTLGGSGYFLGHLEGEWFPTAQPDFTEYTISEVTLHVDDLVFLPTGQFVDFTFTISVYGDRTVPVATRTWGAIKAMYR